MSSSVTVWLVDVFLTVFEQQATQKNTWINLLFVLFLFMGFVYNKKNKEYHQMYPSSKKDQMFITFQGFFLLEKIHYKQLFCKKRIRFHFALPSVGLRAEVARQCWLSLWWRDPLWARFSLITSTGRYRDMCIHTCTMPTHTHTDIQRSFSRSAVISGRLLALTHCCAERGFNGLTWRDWENTSDTSPLSRRTKWWQWRSHGSGRRSALPLSTTQTSCEQKALFILHLELLRSINVWYKFLKR